jgi:hypothetical protein
MWPATSIDNLVACDPGAAPRGVSRMRALRLPWVELGGDMFSVGSGHACPATCWANWGSWISMVIARMFGDLDSHAFGRQPLDVSSSFCLFPSCFLSSRTITFVTLPLTSRPPATNARLFLDTRRRRRRTVSKLFLCLGVRFTKVSDPYIQLGVWAAGARLLPLPLELSTNLLLRWMYLPWSCSTTNLFSGAGSLARHIQFVSTTSKFHLFVART